MMSEHCRLRKRRKQLELTVIHVHDLPMAKVIALAKIRSVLNVGRQVIFEVVKLVRRRKVLRMLTR